MTDKKNSTIDLARYLIKRGRVKAALEKVIGFLEQNSTEEFKEITNELILLLCQTELLEGKLSKNLISFQDSEVTENRILNATIKLLDQFEEMVKLITPNQIKHESSQIKLVGTWKCNEISPTSGNENQIVWTIKKEFHQALYFDNKSGSLRKRTPEKSYEVIGDFCITKQKNGKTTKGRIEWIDDNKFLYTIIDGTKPHLTGHKRLYQRIK
ncbi:MAG: hypothetical protein H6558_21150 [Lewinellaceae bacterium]|nr:hypothetical protein [Lewinellaceae bacterium]MCB9293436.1 hypothetical protein [Lewinellaceae bacterium]